ncbi:hypothetical protein CWI38_0293p0060 [Hamiltosporidium tvaerminnensis]|uniref:Leucine-rich repeat-containing protein n=1 Tax=Hamiltosporidium tvaerminnensis TaxID=1176355 RepID=A0A4Q9LYM2_9MICR|nr:hypothetical protein CWI38_0293p0060 [Hamiltosporidium tvaerminnensis]
MYVYFIRSFLVLESLILKSKVLSKIRYDFSEFVSDDLKYMEIHNLTFNEKDRFIFTRFVKMWYLKISNCSFKGINFNEMFSPYKEYKFTCIALTGIDILIEDVIFLKNLSHLTELNFNNCHFIERSYLSLTKKNFSGLKLLVCNIFFEDSRAFVDYSKDLTMFLSTEFSGDVLHVQNVFNHFS